MENHGATDDALSTVDYTSTTGKIFSLDDTMTSGLFHRHREESVSAMFLIVLNNLGEGGDLSIADANDTDNFGLVPKIIVVTVGLFFLLFVIVILYLRTKRRKRVNCSGKSARRTYAPR